MIPLKDDEKRRCVQCSERLSRRNDAEGESFLDRIIKLDEDSVHHFDPETKNEFSVCNDSITPQQKKARN